MVVVERQGSPQVPQRQRRSLPLEVHEGAPVPAFGEVGRLLDDVVEQPERQVEVVTAETAFIARPEQQIRWAARMQPDALDALRDRLGGALSSAVASRA